MSPSGFLRHPARLAVSAPQLVLTGSSSRTRAHPCRMLRCSCALRSPEMSPSSGCLPTRPFLGSRYTLHRGAQDSPPTPHGARSWVGAPAGAVWLEPPREVPNCCRKLVELDPPLQTATRTGLFFFFSLLSVPCPPAVRVSACVPPMPKLGCVYYRSAQAGICLRV